MTETAKLKAINCITCGAALPALAGNKAKSLICNYCGSVMDRHDDYKLLVQYRDMQRPDGPFRVGMSGALFGVEHTIVGIVGTETYIEGEPYSWTSYQIYAPTHGYSWLTWYDGHLTHTRKTRDIPAAGDPSTDNFWPKSTVTVGERAYQMFEKYTARIIYIEGELTWIPKLGDRTEVVESIDPPYGYAVSISKTETEYERSTYLDQRETLEAFGFDEPIANPYGVHAIQPFRPGWLHGPMAKASSYALPLALVSAIGLMAIGGGSGVTRDTIRNPAGGGSVVFNITNATQLAELRITAPVRNSWAWYDMELLSEDSGETIAEFSKGVEYYQGVEDGERWTEGSTSATLRFKPPAAGAYRLQVEGIEQGSDNVPLTVSVREGVMLSRYPFYLTLFFALVVGSLMLRRWRFEGNRWGSFEEDD